MGTELKKEELRDLRTALREHGEQEVADELEVSRMSVLRAAAGLPVLRSTRKAIVAGLDELLAEDEEDADTDEEDGEDEEEADAAQDSDDDEDAA